MNGTRGRLMALRILAAAGKIKIPKVKIDGDWFEGRMKKQAAAGGGAGSRLALYHGPCAATRR